VSPHRRGAPVDHTPVRLLHSCAEGAAFSGLSQSRLVSSDLRSFWQHPGPVVRDDLDDIGGGVEDVPDHPSRATPPSRGCRGRRARPSGPLRRHVREIHPRGLRLRKSVRHVGCRRLPGLRDHPPGLRADLWPCPLLPREGHFLQVVPLARSRGCARKACGRIQAGRLGSVGDSEVGRVTSLRVEDCEGSPPVSQYGFGSYATLSRFFLALPLGWASAPNSLDLSWRGRWVRTKAPSMVI
jgi:hypothetical protein